jgi:hypothetical protein
MTITCAGGAKGGLNKDMLLTRGITLAEPIYNAKGPPQAKRADLAMAIFVDRPYLKDVLLDCFVSTWGDTLQRTVRGAALALLSGQAIKGGMLEMVRGNLRWLLEDFLKTTYLTLASDYGLEALARLPKGALPPPSPADAGDESTAQQRFAEASLRTLVGLAPTDVTGVLGADSIQAPCSVQRAPTMPMFAQTMKALSQLTADAAEEATGVGGDSSVAAVERAAQDMLRDDPDLDALVRAIERSPALFDRFLTDVLHLRLGFHGAQSHELAVLMELARMLLAPRGNSAAFQSVVRVLLLPRHLTGMPALAQVR